jgi:glycosyltransferase involved in cell wall biosynthesis
MKKIVLMPIKNEEWILEKSLSCASLWADHIIIADQGSTDRTIEICKKFEKVFVIENSSQTYNEHERRQLLLNAARNFEGNNLIFNLAADEIVTANITDEDLFAKVFSSSFAGVGFSFPWVHLWRSQKEYRNDNSMWSWARLPCAFIDDRQTNFQQGFAHLSRIPESYIASIKEINEIKILHYQFVDWEAMLLKQRWARVLEFEHGFNDTGALLLSLKLNNKYYVTKDERDIHLDVVPQEWVKNFPEVPIYPNLDHWRYDETLVRIKKMGPHLLRWLDIWDCEWGSGVRDPRGILQWAYHSLQPVLFTLYNKTPKGLKNIIKRII